MHAEAETMAAHPIRVVARRTGLTPELIRVWERRYGAVEPRRSATNRRLYTDGDIERLELLRLATEGGRRIGDVAGLGVAELERLVAADRNSAPRPRRRPTPARDPSPHLESCLAAIEALDVEALETALADASLGLGAPTLIERLLMPMLAEVGRRWHDGTLRVSQEHMATAIVRSFLQALRAGRRAPRSAPELLVATPAGQHHELGALAAAAAATLDGWRVTYLGPDLPAEEIAAGARMRQAEAVALSLIFPADDPRLGHELRTLRRLLGDDVTLIAGGAAAAAYGEALREVGAVIGDDLEQLRALLERVRSHPARG